MSKKKLAESPKLPFMDHYKIMWPFVKPYMFRAILAIALCIPIGALDAVVALALKPYMDVVLVDKSDQSPAYIPLISMTNSQIQAWQKGKRQYNTNYKNSKKIL